MFPLIFSFYKRTGHLSSPYGNLTNMMSLCTVYEQSRLQQPVIKWDKNNKGYGLSIKGINVTKRKLYDLYQTLSRKGNMLLERLCFGFDLDTMIKKFYESDMQDDFNNSKLEYSILELPFFKDMKRSIDEFLFQQPTFAKFILSIEDNGALPIKKAITSYIQDSEDLVQILLVLIHLSGGQPSRATELASLHISNKEESMRNLFIYEHQVVLLTSYNKVNALNGKDNVIARFLTSGVTKLLLMYLCLVRRVVR